MPTIIRGIKSIFRNKFRNILIILILTLALSLALMMINMDFSLNQNIRDVNELFGSSFGFGLSLEYIEELEKKGVRTIEDDPELLGVDEAIADEIAKIPSVKSVEKIISGGFYSKKLTVPGITIIEKGGNKIEPVSQGISNYITFVGEEDPILDTIVKGNNFNRNDIEQNVAIIADKFAERNKLDVGSNIIIKGEKIKVIGIYKNRCESSFEPIFVPFKTAQRLLGCEGKVNGIAVIVDSIDNVQKTVNYVNNKFSDGRIKAQYGFGEENPSILFLNNIKRISKVTMISSSIVAILIILSIMFINVRNRSREIGILKAIGASNFNISAQFLTESISLCIIALILSTAITLVINQPLTDFIYEREKTKVLEPEEGEKPLEDMAVIMELGNEQPVIYEESEKLKSMNLNTIFSPQILIFAILLTFLIGAIGSLIPAYYISKLRPAEVLRFG